MKTHPISLGFAFAASLLIAQQAFAGGFIAVDPVAGIVVPPPHVIVRPPVFPPGHTPLPPAHPPLLKGQVTYGLSLQSENISVTIGDQVAKTHVCEVFANDSDRNLAGTYLFPLPDDTTFSSFSLQIDGKPVEGKILEANEARTEYEQIVRRMVDPGLLEYADYKTVRARIFPIPAHGTKKVELEYTQILHGQDGMIKYRFPMKSAGQSGTADDVQVNVKLASKQDLRTIWSPTHKVDCKREGEHQAKIAYIAKDAPLDKDFLLYYSVSDKDVAANLLTHKVDGEDGYFLLTLTPPVATKHIEAKDIVLVADTSGSMEGEKMDECKKALKYVVNGLNAEDRFSIVQFNTDVERFRKQLVSATPENKKLAQSWIDDLEATGGTNIGDALHMADTMLVAGSERPAYVILMTDGEPTVGETSVANLIKTIPASKQVRVFDFGVGYDVNTQLLNKLADANHGVAQYVEPDESLETTLSQFYNRIKAPVLSNVSISYSGIEVKNVYPKEVKDLFAGNQVLLLGRYKGAGHATLNVTGTIDGATKKYTFPLNFQAEDDDHSYLPRLWAMRRIGNLTDLAQENGSNREMVDEIIALSKKYGIISAYTSFLVTDPSENHRIAAGPVGMVPLGAGGMIPSPRRGVAGGSASMVLGSMGGGGAMFSRSKAGGPYFAAASPPPPAEMQILDARPVISMSYSGASAVRKSKDVLAFKSAEVASNSAARDQVKAIDDKTFYLIDGCWTDSAYDKNKSPKPETIEFASKRYFDLVKAIPALSKYLSCGKQMIIIYGGHCYKIVESNHVT